MTLGASRWSTFTQVTLLVLKPGLYVGGLYAFMTSFGEVPVTVVLSGSNYMTFPVEIFNAMQFDFEPTILAASTLVTALSLATVLAVQRLVGLEDVRQNRRRRLQEAAAQPPKRDAWIHVAHHPLSDPDRLRAPCWRQSPRSPASSTG